MNFPPELKYTKDHEWVAVAGSEAFIGITAFAARELGDIVYVDIPAPCGTFFLQHDVFGTIEAVKTVSDLFMPTGGVLQEVNRNLQDQPQLVNTDPYGDGWLIRVELRYPLQLNSLLTAEQYRALIGC